MGVTHTVAGKELLGNFLFRIAKLKGGWDAASFIEQAIDEHSIDVIVTLAACLEYN